MKWLRDFHHASALKYGAKIGPADMAGMVGQPLVGDIYYVDANNGSNSNGGTSWNDALATLTKAEDQCSTNNYDVIIVAPAGTSATAEPGTITWDKNHITVIGAAAPTMIGQRSRISWDTDSTDPCITVSGHGNRFINMKWSTTQASNDVLMNMTGDRNYYNNIHFAGICNATTGDDTSARNIVLTGSHENTFDGCMIGEDTAARSGANANLELAGASKNTFNDCMFLMNADNTGALHVKSTGATGASGWNRFNNTIWYAKWTNQADKIAAVFNLSAQTQTCAILMTGSQLMVGADDWEAADSSLIWFERATATANVIGIGLNPNVS
ncbi:MAG: hypothetical protein GY861_03160 [bacterium]|nr:hypothetical protein [bacterium]